MTSSTPYLFGELPPKPRESEPQIPQRPLILRECPACLPGNISSVRSGAERLHHTRTQVDRGSHWWPGVGDLGEPFPAWGAMAGSELGASEEDLVPSRPPAGPLSQNVEAPTGSHICPLLPLPPRPAPGTPFPR